MNSPSFFRGAARALFALAIAGLTAACTLPLGPAGEGNLTIILSKGAMSRALDPATEAALSYKLDFSGPGGETFTRTTEPGTPSLSLSLKPGSWTIHVEASLNGALYGTGEAEVTIEPGKTTQAAIPMQAHRTFYVASGGSGDGSEASPFGTVDEALGAIRAAYSGNWPNKGNANADPARILISGSITAGGTTNGLVEVKDDSGLYINLPPIILAGKGTGADAGTLNATGLSKRVLYIANADVTLSDNLTLTGGSVSGNGGGVYVDGGIFTMTGGEISGNTAQYGGGVDFNSAGNTFTMTGGTISDNGANAGGGVLAFSGTFDMRGGNINDNEAEIGGGVYVSVNGSFTLGGTAQISDNEAIGTPISSGGGVYASGNFTMSESANISDNEADFGGGGVYIASGTFTMSGGTIGGNTDNDKNTATDGGGVYIASGGDFTMSAGTIIGNTATESGGGVFFNSSSGTFTMSGGTIGGTAAADANTAADGGGVYIAVGGDFTMSAGTIIGNTATNGQGGGVYFLGTTFDMEGNALISGNKAEGSGGGGGVYFGGDTFTMSDSAAISGNQSSAEGGGVYIPLVNAFFNMNSGTISGNTAVTIGGGVCFESPKTFTIDGGTISGNTASRGGGVYLGSAYGTFTKTGGTIYGKEEEVNTNTATSGNTYGHAVYKLSGPKYRDTTADPGVSSSDSDFWE